MGGTLCGGMDGRRGAPGSRSTKSFDETFVCLRNRRAGGYIHARANVDALSALRTPYYEEGEAAMNRHQADHERKAGRSIFGSAARCASSIRLLACLAGLMVLSGCYGCWGPLFIHDDSWRVADKTISTRLIEWEEEEMRFWEVIPEKQQEAQALLSEATYVQLTEEQAREFAGQELPDPGSTKPYLIRAVYLWLGPEGFTGFTVGLDKEGWLYPHHMAMGGATAWKVKRYALIVRLASPPKEVIPRCGAMI